MAAPYIGARISLVSKKGIRYEGTLATIDTENSNIALQAVRSLGTEGRRLDGPQISGSDETYDYIVFRGADIQDLEVISGGSEGKSAPSAAVAPAAAPAAAPTAVAPPAATPKAAAPQVPPNAWGNPNAPKTAPAKAASMAMAGLGPKQQGAKQQGAKQQGAKSGGGKGAAAGGQPATVKAGAAAPVKKPASFAAAVGGGGGGVGGGGGRAAPPGGPRGGQGGPRYPQHQQRPGGYGHPQQQQQYMAHQQQQQGRHMVHPPRPAFQVPTEDFDFSASTAKFEKITAEPQAHAEPAPSAYEKDDFFDSLSNEETKMGNQRPNYSQMKRVDAETFGGVPVAGYPGGQRGYGNQRRGMGRGGGRNGGQQQHRNANSRGSWKKQQN